MGTTKHEQRKRDYRRYAVMRQDIVSQLFKRGYSYAEIRREVMARLDLKTYSLSTVCKDVNTLLEEWRKCRIDNLDYSLQLELERIDELIKEAWAAWEKSKEDGVEKTSKQKGVPTGDDDGGVATIAMEQMQKEVHPCGDPRYLDMIHKLLIERRKLLGLYAANRTEITGKDGTPLLPERMSIEEINKEIERLRHIRTH